MFGPPTQRHDRYFLQQSTFLSQSSSFIICLCVALGKVLPLRSPQRAVGDSSNNVSTTYIRPQDGTDRHVIFHSSISPFLTTLETQDRRQREGERERERER